jgi:toxin YoeB
MPEGKERGEPTAPMPKASRSCVFDKDFREDLQRWLEQRPRVARRMLEIVEAVMRDPFGIGKPEPLKQLGAGTWSRRLTEEHRIVCVVLDNRIVFVQGRYHY